MDFNLFCFLYTISFIYTLYYGLKITYKTIFKVTYKYKDYSKNDNIYLIFYDYRRDYTKYYIYVFIIRNFVIFIASVKFYHFFLAISIIIGI